MSDADVERVIRYHLSPINISFQTMNPELRCKMLNNRFAGEALSKIDRFMEAGIAMNGQIVLCKGVNDGAELDYSIRALTKYIPNLESVSVVPVGLSKFREGLYPLEPFNKEDAIAVLELIHGWQDKIYAEHGIHFVHASDEWYIMAERELPPEENYDGYLQLENGVGMIRLLTDEFEEALFKLKKERRKLFHNRKQRRQRISIATAKLAYPCIKQMAEEIMLVCPEIEICVYLIINQFFGEMITVSGLLTAQDIIAQLKEKELGERLLLPENVLRSGEQVFLDDLTLTDVETALQVKIDIVKSSGQDFVAAVLGDSD
jgi:putative radical SAM enzyme (TIGR03279 family)